MPKLSNALDHYQKSPKMLAAFHAAIKDHGPDADYFIVYGKPSKNPRSNCYAQAQQQGFSQFDIYPGAHRRRGTEGFVNVVVGTKILS